MMCSQKLTECILNLFFFKCNYLICDSVIIICKANKCCMQSGSSVKTVKVVYTEHSCHLSCSVRSEIEEYYRIIVLYSLCTFHCKRYYELIVLVVIIRLLYTLCRTCLLIAALGHYIVSRFHSVPTVVSVHCIETSHHRCNLTYAYLCHLIFKLGYKLLT